MSPATASARLRLVDDVKPEPASTAALGRPVVFGSTMGLLYPGEGDVAVLMVGAVGYEELCARSTWRALAEAISAAGAPCLRFDLPGVGDALAPTGVEGIDDWRAAVAEAAAFLKSATGRARIAIVGQGMGGALAALQAPSIPGVEAVVLMAPVTSGRLHLRELALWGATLVERIGIGPDPDQTGGVSVGGIAIEPGRMAAIKALDLASLGAAPAPRALVVGRLNHGGDERLAERLETLGVTVDRSTYEGYELIASDPTQARPPAAVVAEVAGWLAALETTGDVWAPAGDAPAEALHLAGDGFRERPFRFGPEGRLFGVLCEPETQREGAAVVFVNAGRDYHIGWARTSVDQARAFARLGLTSLRFDCGGVGDSPAAESFKGEVLYSQDQIGDVVTAIDEMARRGHARIGLVGRCSGSYSAFHAAARDKRVTDVVMINAVRFVWDPREDVTEALRYAHRSLGDFGTTMLKRNGFSRLLKGELRVAPAAKFLAQRISRAAARRLAPYLGGLTQESRIFREVHRMFRTLAERKANVWIVYSENDPGLAELESFFGPGGVRLVAYQNVRRATVPEADHNFTHRGARERLFATLADVFAK